MLHTLLHIGEGILLFVVGIAFFLGLAWYDRDAWLIKHDEEDDDD